MVNPLLLFIIFLGISFLLPLLVRFNRKVSNSFFYLALLVNTIIPAIWLFKFIKGLQIVQIFTAGFYPPVSINLQFGITEAFFVFSVNLLGFLGALYLANKFKSKGIAGKILLLLLIMGLDGIIMTRDLFNLFVFLEISSLATYALISLDSNKSSLSAGFKYMIAGGISSALFLIGTIFLYRFSGTLNIDAMLASIDSWQGQGSMLALILLMSAILIELKQFPANGWALDVYQSTEPGVAAIISSASSGAVFFAFYKILPLLDISLILATGIIGMATFVLMNLMALRQSDSRRLLGYSSISQFGLMIGLFSLFRYYNIEMNLEILTLVFGSIFLNHFLAKAGLFWLAGYIKDSNLQSWSIFKQYPSLLFFFGCFIFALAGLPPFPGFWAKWQAVMLMSAHNMSSWMWILVIGSLLESAYLFKWFGIVFKTRSKTSLKLRILQIFPNLIFFILLIYTSLLMMNYLTSFNLILLLPIIIGAILNSFRLIPFKFKGVITIATPLIYLYYLLPQLSAIYGLFGYIFLGGSAIIIITTLAKSKQNNGYYSLLIILILSLGNLLVTTSTLAFFYNWEIIALSSYLLILQSKSNDQTALRFILFSLGGAFLILLGFAYGYADTASYSILTLNRSGNVLIIYLLMILGFLTKIGAAGLHVWLPGTYAESEDNFSSLLSAVVSKIGIFGIILTLILLGKSVSALIDYNTFLGWIGLLTAFFGALMAVFQEDIKLLLAYSSMGQIGYVILSLALFNHFGWTTAIYLSINHLLFKGILFMAVAGLIYRVKTRNMYQLGGLIKKMPFSFIAVLIAIIALSGVPPLSGFGSKWLLYTALIEKGWYLQAGIAFFASTIAFLYCFRLIHAIFLGQEKIAYKKVQEAPVWYLIPQYIFIFMIMAISTFPSLILKPISNAVAYFFSPEIQINGYNIESSLGYWNGNSVMIVTMVVFMLPLIWILLRIRAIQKVRQFNIVYAAERPDGPETTHYAYNFYSHYKKALGFLITPLVSRFWKNTSEWTRTIAGALRNIYTGNGQTYALQIIMFVVLYYLLSGVIK